MVQEYTIYFNQKLPHQGIGHRMARPSMDYCEDGKLVFFEDATHWAQHDEAENVTNLLLDFLGSQYINRPLA